MSIMPMGSSQTDSQMPVTQVEGGSWEWYCSLYLPLARTAERVASSAQTVMTFAPSCIAAQASTLNDVCPSQ